MANVFNPKLARDDPVLRTESWLMENVQKMDSQIHEASQALRYYQEALPLLKQAKDAIDPVIASNMDLSDSAHLQKVNHSGTLSCLLKHAALESSALIADTCLSAAWSSLSAADPGLELSTPTLPPLPDDVTNWIYQVKPIIKQLVSETSASIQSKENEISHCKSKKEQFEEQLRHERRRVLIEAVNGPISVLPPTYSEIMKEQAHSNPIPPLTHLSVKPQLPPRKSNERLDQTIPQPETVVKTYTAFSNEWNSETLTEDLSVKRAESPQMSRTASARSLATSYKAEPTFSKRMVPAISNEWTSDSPIKPVSPQLSRGASTRSELQRTPSVNVNEWTAASPTVPRTASPLKPQTQETYVRVPSGLGRLEPEHSQGEQTESVQASSFNSTLIEDNPWG